MATPNDNRPTTDDTVVSQEPPEEYDFETLQLPEGELQIREDVEPVVDTRYLPASETYNNDFIGRSMPLPGAEDYDKYELDRKTRLAMLRVGYKNTDLKNPRTKASLKDMGYDPDVVNQVQLIEGLTRVKQERDIAEEQRIQQALIKADEIRVSQGLQPNQPKTEKPKATGEVPGYLRGEARDPFSTQSTYDIGVTGQVYKSDIYRTGDRQNINRPDSPQQYYDTLYRLHPPEIQKKMEEVKPENLEESGGFLSGLDYWFSPLMTPQSVLHYTTAQLATVLPNPDDTGILGETLGKALQGAAAYMYTKDIDTYADIHSFSEEKRNEYTKLESDLAKLVYARVATGNILDNYTSTYEGTLVGEIPFAGMMPRARGTEAIDGIITIEEAQRYVQKAEELGVEPNETIRHLASPIGRELYGIAAEIIYDPLWLLGPAKAAKTFVVGGQAMNVGADGVKVIDAVADTLKIGQDEAADLFIRAVVLGEPEATAKLYEAQKAVDATITAKQNNIAKIDATLNSKQAQPILDEAAIEAQRQLDEVNEFIKHGETLGRNVSGQRTINTQKVSQQTAQKYKAAAAQGKTQLETASKIKKGAEKERILTARAVSVADAAGYLRTGRYAQEAGLASAKATKAPIDNAISALKDADAIRNINKTMGVRQAGKFAVHIPLTKSTYYASDIKPFTSLAGTLTLKPVKGVDTLASISAQSAINVTDLQRLNGVTTKSGKHISKTVDELEAMVANGEDIIVGFGPKGIFAKPIAAATNIVPGAANFSTFRKTVQAKIAKGEKLEGVENIIRMQIFGKRVFDLPFKAANLFFQFVGTTMYQPLIQTFEYNKALAYYQQRGINAAQLDRFLGGRKSILIYLQRANSKMWKQYNQAIKNHQQAIINGQDQILTTIARLEELSNAVAKTRKNQTGQDIIDEATRYREMGTNPTEDMMEIARALEEVIQTVKNTAGKEEEQVRQALQNIARFAAGDPKLASQIQEQLSTLNRQLDATFDAAMEGKYTLDNQPMPTQVLVEGLEQPTSVSKVVDEIRTAKDNVRKSQEFLEKGGKADAIKADVKLKREKLAKQIENLKAQKNYTAPDVVKIEDTLRDVNKLRRELRATLSQQVKNVKRIQEEFLTVNKKLFDKKKQEAIQKSKAKGKVVRGKTRDDFKADKDLIRKQRTLKSDIQESIRTQKELEVVLDSLKADADVIKKTLLPKARKAAKKEGIRILRASDKALGQSVKAGQKKQFKQLMTDLNKKENDIRLAIDRFDDLSQNPDSPLFYRGNTTDARVRAELEKAYKQVKAKKARIAELMGELKTVEPRLVVSRFKAKPGDDYVRALEDWEVGLWNKYNAAIEPFVNEPDGIEKVMQAMLLVFKRDERMTPEQFRKLRKKYTGTDIVGGPKAVKVITPEETQRLSDLKRSLKITQSQQRILARAVDAGTASKSDIKRVKTLNKKIDDTQESINKLEAIRDQDALYPSVIGERFADVPPELEPIVAELDILLETYQLLFKKHGYDFVKDPADIVRQFGVAKYVPHMSKLSDPSPIQMRNAMSKLESGDLDSVLANTLQPDAAKTRTLMGTIEEINSLVKAEGSEDWLFVMDPERLHARLLSSTKATAGKEMFLTLIRTGAIRGFKDRTEAAAAGYVPLLNRKSEHLQNEYLLRGKKGELVDETGRVITDEQFDTILERLLKYKGDDYLENLDRSMMQDMKSFKNAANIDRVVASIRAAQDKIINGKIPNDLFGNTTKVIDVKERHVEVLQNLRAEQNQKYADRLDALANKKQTDRTVESQAKMKERLDEGSDIYQREQKGLERKAWSQVAQELNTMSSQLRNAKYADFNEDVLKILAGSDGILKPLSGTELKMFYGDQPVMGMYVQESIQNSLNSYFSPNPFMKGEEDKLARQAWNAMVGFGNWWKTNITVASVMYHTRNFVGNEVNMMVDVGAGALNLDTRLQALQLSVLIDLYSKHGSLEKAYQAILKARKNPTQFFKNTESILGEKAGIPSRLAQTGKKLITDYVDETLGKLRTAIDSRIDLGDGVSRTYDEALDIMQQRGVISGNADYRIEIDAAKNALHEATLNLGAKEKKLGDIVKKAGDVAQDMILIGASGIVTGGIPIAMTRGMGKSLARRTENQVRAANFIANLKKGRSIDDAVQHVEKFFFNYQDVTPTQRKYLKHAFPFFTWRIKNIHQHMMYTITKPQFLANVNRMFFEFMPVVDQTLLTGKQVSLEEAREANYEREKKLPKYSRYRLKIPGTLIPGIPVDVDENGNLVAAYDAVGLGLPIEDFAMQITQPAREAMVGPSGVTGSPPETVENVIAQMHPLVKGFYMLGAQREPFYRKGLEEPSVRRAEDIALMINGLNQINPMLGHFVQESYGITTTAYQFGRKQGQPKYMVTEDYGTSPQGLVRMGGDVFPPMVAMERAIREAAALNGLVQSGDMDINMVDDLGYLRFVQALFGLKIKKRPDEEYLDYYYNKMLLDAIKTKTDDIGITTDGKVK